MKRILEEWAFIIVSVAILVAIIFGIFQLAVLVKTHQCKETVQVLSEYFSKELAFKYNYNVGCMLSEDGVRFIPVENIKVTIGE